MEQLPLFKEPELTSCNIEDKEKIIDLIHDLSIQDVLLCEHQKQPITLNVVAEIAMQYLKDSVPYTLNYAIKLDNSIIGFASINTGWLEVETENEDYEDYIPYASINIAFLGNDYRKYKSIVKEKIFAIKNNIFNGF